MRQTKACNLLNSKKMTFEQTWVSLESAFSWKPDLLTAFQTSRKQNFIWNFKQYPLKNMDRLSKGSYCNLCSKQYYWTKMRDPPWLCSYRHKRPIGCLGTLSHASSGRVWIDAQRSEYTSMISQPHKIQSLGTPRENKDKITEEELFRKMFQESFGF